MNSCNDNKNKSKSSSITFLLRRSPTSEDERYNKYQRMLNNNRLFNKQQNKKLQSIWCFCCTITCIVSICFCIHYNIFFLRKQQQQQNKVNVTTTTGTTTTSLSKSSSSISVSESLFVPPQQQQIQFESYKDWKPLITENVSSPYTEMAPQLDVIWSRGWYNIYLPHKETPIGYYNEAGRATMGSKKHLLKEYFNDNQCGPIWIRGHDLYYYATEILPKIKCNVIIITSDCILVRNRQFITAEKIILNNEYVQEFYLQNLEQYKSIKLKPIPLGIPLHYGYVGSPNTITTINTMNNIRNNHMKSFTQRVVSKPTILVDKGTTSGGGLRKQAREEMVKAVENCNNNDDDNDNNILFELMSWKPTVQVWEEYYTQYHFATAARGTGWDTYRVYEYMFFQTVPIVKYSSFAVHLYLSSYMPIILVQDWDELCYWNNTYYNDMVNKYSKWIENSHYWLQPHIWIPRNQTKFEVLCDTIPYCREITEENQKRFVYITLDRVEKEIIELQQKYTISTSDYMKENYISKNQQGCWDIINSLFDYTKFINNENKENKERYDKIITECKQIVNAYDTEQYNLYSPTTK